MQDTNPSSSPPKPFSPGEPGTPQGGCARPVWIGCALLILLAGIGAMVLLWNGPKLFDWAMEKFEVEVMDALPDDISAGQRERLARAFDAATDAANDGSADAQAFQNLMEMLFASSWSAEEGLSEADVEELIEALEAVAAGPVPAPETPVLESPGS